MICPLSLALSLAALSPGHETPVAPALAEHLPALQETVDRGGQPQALLPYTYVEAGYGTLSGYSVDSVEADVDLLSVAGSLELTPSVHVFLGGATATSIDASDPAITDTDVSTWFAGVGLNEDLTPNLSGFARLAVAGSSVEATAAGSPYKQSDSSLVYSLGARYFAFDSLELSLIALSAAESGAKINLEASALYRVQPDLGVGLVATMPGRDEDGDSLGLGIRWYF